MHTSPDSGGATRSRRHVILAGAAICAWPSTDLLAGGDASTFLPAAASFVVEYPMATEFLKYTPIVLCQAMFLTGMKDMQKIKAQGRSSLVARCVRLSRLCGSGACKPWGETAGARRLQAGSEAEERGAGSDARKDKGRAGSI